jgi:ATP-binding cassette subfamily F protein uup
MPTFDLGLEHVSLAYATKNVFTDVTQGVNEGDRIGIVGRNGDGKSSLLKLLGDQMQPDSGRVTRRHGLSMGILGQRDELDGDATIRHAALEDRADHEWAADPRSRDIVQTLLADIPLDSRIQDLSGGQRRRADLARLLLHNWDILALDEPTNHLDIVTIHWLADHLLHRWPEGQGALLVVTHDRWFLDEVCSSMWEVHDGTIDPFVGGYSAYVLQRVERDRQAQRMEDRRQNIARKELAWLTRGARARATKQKFHVKEAKAIIADVPPVRNTLELKAMATSRLGKEVVTLKNVTKRYPIPNSTTGAQRTVINDLSWIIGPGDRFGIVGANGAGKSTLLKLIDGSLKPDEGTVKIGKTVKFAVLSQRLDEVAALGDSKVKEVLHRYKSTYMVDGKEYSPAQLLERLGFNAAQMMTPVCDLSGGQKRRMQLMLILLDEPNVLVLDEPGNDLDTDMLRVMEDLLDDWPGTLIVVSHDRFLLERVTDQQFALMDGTIRHLPGGVDDYIRLVDQRRKHEGLLQAEGVEPQAGSDEPSDDQASTSDSALSVTSSAPNTQSAENAKALARKKYQAGKKQRSIELQQKKAAAAIARQEKAMALAAQKASDPSATQDDFKKLGDLTNQLHELQDRKSQLDDQWLELEEILES